ncbi:NAD(P)-binding domain-containing protein [Streptomyces sp. NPDC002793]|uniref:NAD(P)-binding domain-containing protein n=1 Tax=Streptomyces sp. NPDC002793 TaxID=3154432 RepID=UPI003322FFE4
MPGDEHLADKGIRGHRSTERLGPRASAATSDEAAASGDIVVITVPVKAFPSLPAAPLAGKAVIDTCNYVAGAESLAIDRQERSPTPGGGGRIRRVHRVQRGGRGVAGRHLAAGDGHAGVGDPVRTDL